MVVFTSWITAATRRPFSTGTKVGASSRDRLLRVNSTQKGVVVFTGGPTLSGVKSGPKSSIRAVDQNSDTRLLHELLLLPNALFPDSIAGDKIDERHAEGGRVHALLRALFLRLFNARGSLGTETLVFQ